MSELRSDSDSFRKFEKAAHDRLALSYHDALTPVTDRAISPLLDAVRAGEGTQLLDVACGPGTLVADATERGARATGIDIAPAMVALAQKRHPDLSFREASAEELPFPDASFDAVVCAFGIGHVSNPERVIAEFRRVLLADGRVALSWWGEFSRNRLNGIFHQVLSELSVSAALPAGPPMDRFTDPVRLADLLRQAGFAKVGVQEISFVHRLPDVEALWDLAMGSFARASSVIRAQPADMQQRIRSAVAEAARAHASASGLDVPVVFRVASARSSNGGSGEFAS